MTLRPHVSVQGWPGDLYENGEQGHGQWAVQNLNACCVYFSLMIEQLSGSEVMYAGYSDLLLLKEFLLGPGTGEQFCLSCT